MCFFNKNNKIYGISFTDVFDMVANYNKLWKLLIDKGMNKTDLRLKTGISTSTLAKISNNEIVSMDVIFRICDVLECNVGDIMDATEKNKE